MKRLNLGRCGAT